MSILVIWTVPAATQLLFPAPAPKETYLHHPNPHYASVRLQLPRFAKMGILTFGGWLVVLRADHVRLGNLNSPRSHTAVASMVGRGAAHTFDQLLVVFHNRVPCILKIERFHEIELLLQRFNEKIIKICE
jgi:hypothetical protein